MLDTDFLDSVRSMGIKKISLEPNLVDLVNYNYGEIARKIFELYKHGNNIGLTVDGYWKKPFSCLIGNKGAMIGSCYAVRGESIAVTTDGKIKPCIYSKEMYSGSKLKEINTVLEYKKFLLRMWIGNIEKCKDCNIEGICLGGCYLSRVMPNDEVFEYRCSLYKKLFQLLVRDFLKENYNIVRNSLKR
jgi:radical SAM protein with 4Fe4S-binding SPASM domain